MPDHRVTTEVGLDAAAPGCYFCGAEPAIIDGGERRQFIDTGLFVDMEGRVIVCSVCVISWSHDLGGISGEKADNLRTNNRKLGAEVKALTKQVDDAKAAIVAATAACA